jgi:hypothetical protein
MCIIVYVLIIIHIIRKKGKITNINFYITNKKTMEAKLKIGNLQEVLVISVDSDGLESSLLMKDLQSLVSGNESICKVVKNDSSFTIEGVSKGSCTIIAQFINETGELLVESLDVIVDEQSKIVSIKFQLVQETKSETVN